MPRYIKNLWQLFTIKASVSMDSGLSSLANHTVMLPLIVWLLAHADERVTVRLNYGALALLAALFYLWIERERRIFIERKSYNGNGPDTITTE